MNTPPLLVTGAAGFIGHHLTARLLAGGHRVVGVDNLSPYYDPQLKRARLAQHGENPAFIFKLLDLSDGPGAARLFDEVRPRVVIHLAAQAGVRQSLMTPDDYVSHNVLATTHVLEGCRRGGVAHLIYASSSSVYGLNETLPFREDLPVDHPISLYAATKRANELMAHTWSHLYGLPTTGLRLFTVYGPWGRPDMALFRFTASILAGQPLQLYNHGDMKRDFTYVDDVVEAIVRLIDLPPEADPRRRPSRPDLSPAPTRLLNVACSSPVSLLDFIGAIEEATGHTARVEGQPMQPGDVPATFADTSALEALIGPLPRTPVLEGVRRFVAWYRSWYGV